MSYKLYALLHHVGLFSVLVALGGTIVGARLGWADTGLRRILVAIHGTGLFILLVAGFGALAKLGVTSGVPGWIIGKIVIWIILGGLVVPIRRAPQQSMLWLVLVPVLGLGSAWLALYKPF
ncbi:MAG TPA: hypothetical protein RMG48_14505 [Myxococcales bacterium LLY-WYZ-16_1]|nr:hypothetical protein [Myxococcales bacterium LLY-WYZ-16_1]